MNEVMTHDVNQATEFVDKVLDHAYDNAGEIKFDERKLMIAELATIFQNIRKPKDACCSS